MKMNVRTANRLFLAFKDMEDVKHYLNAFDDLLQLQNERNNGEYFYHCEAIMIAAIVTYCRSFKRSKSGQNAASRIDPNSIDLFADTPELKRFHEQLIERRDRAVAHADWEYHKTFLVDKNYKGGTLRKSPKQNLTGNISSKTFRELADHVSMKCSRLGFDIDRDGC